MRSSIGKLTAAALLALPLLVPAPPARAAAHPIEIVGAAARSIVFGVRDRVAALFGKAPEETVTPPTPSGMIMQIEGNNHSQFWDYLKDAGYDLADIETSVGIIPDIKVSFQLVRELSEADRDWLQQELEADALRRRGLTAKVQRRIIQTLLDASEFREMRINKLVIGILPLPSADFVVEPTNAPLSEEHDQIYRALLNKSQRRFSTKSELPDTENTSR